MGIDFKALLDVDPRCEIQYHEPLKNHTTFKIGGPADMLISPTCVEGVEVAIKLCINAELPYVILGNGSNVLVTDKGIRGAVIKLADPLNQITIEGETIIADAGVLLSKLSNTAKENHLSGLEFASGIPGTLGGATFMNAGAYGGEMKDVIQWVEALTKTGEKIRLSISEMTFGYRTSIFKKDHYTVLRCGIKLQARDKEEIQATMNDLTEKRVSKQPLEMPSAGSTFKRPVGYFAGQLIDNAGLRGLKFGDAQVSQKHCGFIVNTGNATCHDVLKLIEVIQKVVYDQTEVMLEREVQILGE